MTNQEKLEVIEEAFNYYHDRNSLTSDDEKELITLVDEIKSAISVTRCSTELKVVDSEDDWIEEMIDKETMSDKEPMSAEWRRQNL